MAAAAAVVVAVVFFYSDGHFFFNCSGGKSTSSDLKAAAAAAIKAVESAVRRMPMPRACEHRAPASAAARHEHRMPINAARLQISANQKQSSQGFAPMNTTCLYIPRACAYRAA